MARMPPKQRPSAELEAITRYIRERLRKEAEENGRGFLARVARETGFTPTHVGKVAGGSGSVGHDFADAMAKFWGYPNGAALTILASAGTSFAPTAAARQLRVAPSEPHRDEYDFERKHRLTLGFAEASDYPEDFLRDWLVQGRALPAKLRENVTVNELWILCQAAHIRWRFTRE